MSDNPQTPLSRRLVLLLAVACGAAVANIYYAQPLLQTLGHAFGASESTAGLLVTFSQIGYVIGLVLLVPIGDLRERRGLICVTLLICAGGLVIAAAAPTFPVLLAALTAIGVTATVAQVIVPMSSSLANENERGRVVGTVMSGLLLGVLLARTASGLLAAVLGWRWVFVFGAGLMVALAGVLRRALPRVPPTTGGSYRRLLGSVFELIRTEPVLRQRMVMGALGYGSFSVLWTALAFLLAARAGPYHYGNAVIGLFGLAGVAGAVAATVAGRLADRGHGARTSTVTIVILLGSWIILDAGRNSVVALLVGIVLLDLGVQGLHISNQSAIYALDAEARSRLTTAYMASSFVGGAVLSALTSSLYAADGWSAVCLLGLGVAALTLIAWAVSSMALHGRDGRLGPAADAAAD